MQRVAPVKEHNVQHDLMMQLLQTKRENNPRKRIGLKVPSRKIHVSCGLSFYILYFNWIRHFSIGDWVTCSCSGFNTMASPIGLYGAGDVLWHHLSTCDVLRIWGMQLEYSKVKKVNISPKVTQSSGSKHFSGLVNLFSQVYHLLKRSFNCLHSRNSIFWPILCLSCI